MLDRKREPASIRGHLRRAADRERRTSFRRAPRSTRSWRSPGTMDSLPARRLRREPHLPARTPRAGRSAPPDIRRGWRAGPWMRSWPSTAWRDPRLDLYLDELTQVLAGAKGGPHRRPTALDRLNWSTSTSRRSSALGTRQIRGGAHVPPQYAAAHPAQRRRSAWSTAEVLRTSPAPR